MLDALVEVLRDENRSVLFSSHNTNDVEQLSDSITFIHQGRLVASQDKESFLDNWRRILCHGTWHDSFGELPEVASARHNGSVIELKVCYFSEEFLHRLQHLGLTVKTIDPMNLEDIFVTTIRTGAT